MTYLESSHIRLEESEQINNALLIFSVSNVDFSDCLILNKAQNKKLTLYTFDKRLSHLYGAKQVGIIDQDYVF
jgi:predicted nucleic-acid-binding protein